MRTTENRLLTGTDYPMSSQATSGDRSAEDWANIFNNLTDMITVHDRDFNIIFANRAAEKILGIPALKTSGAKCFKFYHGSESPPGGCPSCGCLHSRRPSLFEMYEPHLRMFLEIRAIPRFDDEGRLIGLIHIVRDITEQRRIQEELDAHREHLEWLVKERTKELTESNEQLHREIAERMKAEKDREQLIGELQTALAKIRTLSGLLPMCAWCNKVRDEENNWKKVDTYIKEHSDALVSHGICPECLEKYNSKPTPLTRLRREGGQSLGS